MAADQGQERHCRYRRQQAVQAIEQSAMPRDQAARVFHAEPAFRQRLGKIAELGDNRKPGTNQY
jgi:hypothetical protein